MQSNCAGSSIPFLMSLMCSRILHQVSSKALFSECFIWISSSDATVNTDHVLLLLSLVQREAICVFMGHRGAGPGRAGGSWIPWAVQVVLSSVQFCSVSRRENRISFHSLLQNVSFSLNVLWFPHHHIPVSLQDASWMTGIYHWQIKREKHTGIRKVIPNPLLASQAGKRGRSPCSSTAFCMAHHDLHLHSLTGPLTGIILSPPVLPCCSAPCWLYHRGRSRSVPFSVLTEVLSTLN